MLFILISNSHMLCYTIQAMVHELIGIEDNKVDLKSIGKFPKDQEVGYISYTGNYVISVLPYRFSAH